MLDEAEVREHIQMGRDAGTQAIGSIVSKVANDNPLGLVALGELTASVMISTYVMMHEQMGARHADDWLSTTMQLFTDHVRQFSGAEVTIQVMRKGD